MSGEAVQPIVTFVLRDRRVALNADGGPPTAKSGFLAKVLPTLPAGEWDMRELDEWHDCVATALAFAIEDSETRVESLIHACAVMTGADYLQLDDELYLPRVLDFVLFAGTPRVENKEDSNDPFPCIDSPNAGNLLWSGMTERGKIVTMLELHADRRLRVAFRGELDISDNKDITQQLLVSAARNFCPLCPIITINAKDAPYVGDVGFCADTLTVLDAGGDCGITQEGISDATKLTTLKTSDNKLIVSVDFCAETLTELGAGGWSCGITQEGISKATKLTTLEAYFNKSVVSVDFCAESLTVLDAACCGITQEGISKSTKLNTLEASDNEFIVSVDFCADTLTVLDAGGDCGITQEGISKATKLITLNASYNNCIVSMDFCADTLTELDASGWRCGITKEGISKATKLSALNAFENDSIGLAM